MGSHPLLHFAVRRWRTQPGVAMMNTASLDAARNHILQKYHVSPHARLSSGMEAEVYAYGPDAVLKLYTGAASLADLHILCDFYNSLDRQLVPYALPHIHTVAQEDHFLITIEQRLAGIPMSAVLPTLTTDQLDAIMQRYLTAALALSGIQAPPQFDRYKLFDSDRLSCRSQGDWHQFLARYLTHKLAQVTPYLNRDVSQFAAKVQQLRTVLSQPYRDDYRLIHGDFFPGNLLINDERHITALLDFGLLTMYGDALFDLATGWVFFDMYDELRARARERYLAMLLDRLGENVRGKLYRCVLIYSVLSANTYSSKCSDGHYRWCVANLSNQDYWNGIE
jgi:fructosamine-3-kinase